MKHRIAVPLMLAASPALAHHPLAGQPMQGFADGLLSGIGHPILGFDHLFFVLAMGLGARLGGVPFRAPLAYVAAMLIGCAGLYAGLNPPLREPMIALSLLVVGGVLAAGRMPGAGALTLMFAGFGLFHGAGFGTSIAAQEGGVSASVLTGYLIGLGALQYALALGAGSVATRHLRAVSPQAMPTRLAGAMVAGIGLFLCLETLEAPLLAFLVAG